MSEPRTLDGLTARPAWERPADTFIREIADSIVSGRYPSDQFLPPEAALAAHFRVSRTIIRESMKRLEEKGLVTVQQGRGTAALPASRWNVLDPLVLSTIIAHDDELHTIDDLTTVRAALEGLMAATSARVADETGIAEVEAALQAMRDTADDYSRFRDADAAFHRTVMRLSKNFLAQNIADTLYSRARSFARFEGTPPDDAVERTLEEHEAILRALALRDEQLAHATMSAHIRDSWMRRSGAAVDAPDAVI